MDDPTPANVDRAFGSLVEDLELDDCDGTDTPLGRLAILVERLRPGDAAPIGARARFLMTTYDDSEDLVAYGWRTDLRVHASAILDVPGLKQPGVRLIDEREHYTGKHEGAVTVEISRVWVERLVAMPALGDAAGSEEAWLQRILDDPNNPIVEPLHPIARRHHLTGARVVHDLGDGRYEHDLRAVSPVLMGDHGKLMVAVVAESHWYRWNDHDYDLTHRPVRALPADKLWVE